MAKKAINTTTEKIVADVYKARQSEVARNSMLEKYIPFIVKSISEITGRYVRIGDSDEFSIGLMAFNEAIDRYDAQRGPFLSYAKLVIASRIKNHIERTAKESVPITVEAIDQIQSDQAIKGYHESNVLEDEIEKWKNELIKFNITFGDLLERKPKHKDTKNRAIEISIAVSQNEPIVSTMFQKYRLPIQVIHQKMRYSVKVLEGSRIFIISVVIIFVKELGAIKRWILRE